VVDAFNPPKLAVNCTGPALMPVARPVSSIVAMLVSELCQFAVRLRSWMLPSEKVPINWTCCVEPSGKRSLDARIASEVTVAVVTMTVLWLDIVPMLAWSVLVPGVTAVSVPS